ncbi:MAG: hypothetical protein A3K22_00525 [Deltaproteobacteria bacterium RBG_16_42_7]|nr:MAG: hypothetical protein A3K22_00525 [Deltaproteobacteria bacterium RBG_16_42_7]
MPIMKYRSLEEAEKALWCFYPTEHYYRRVSGFYELFCKLLSPSYPKGVFKYKDINDANRQRFEWDISRGIQKDKSYQSFYSR